MESGGRGESSEGHGRSDLGSDKGAAATEIRQATQEQERVGGGEYGQRIIVVSQGT